MLWASAGAATNASASLTLEERSDLDADERTRCFGVPLEGEAHTQNYRPFRVRGVGLRTCAARDARDLPERARGETSGRVCEDRRVKDVPGLDAHLKPPLTAHRKESEKGQIEVVPAWTVELVSSHATETNPGRLRELGRIEPGAVRGDVAGHDK